MKQVLKDNLVRYSAGECQTARGLCILPIFAGGSGNTRPYISLHEAMRQGCLDISEVSEGGSVPNLRVVNRGKIPVLLLDGEELRGAKQNRVLNSSILVDAESELVVPVSCTEAGRWSYSRRNFEESGNMMAAQHRSGKMADVSMSLKMSGEFRSNQGRVWEDINRFQEEHSAHSPTSAMEDVYRSRGEMLDEICAAFPLLGGQCGIYVGIGGQFAGLDLVSQPEVWRDLHSKLVRSYAIDAVSRRLPESPLDPGKLDGLFSALLESDVSNYRSVGLGEDLRLEGRDLTGSALLWDKDLVHLAAYPSQRHSEQIDQGRYHSPRHRVL